MLDPELIEIVLASLLDRRQEGVERRSQHIGELRQRATEADHRLNRLYDAIEAGSLDPAKSALSERIAGLTAIRNQARADGRPDRSHAPKLDAQRPHGRGGVGIGDRGAQSAPARRGRLSAGSRSGVRPACRGRRRRNLHQREQGTLLRTLVAAKGRKSAGVDVPGFIPKWRMGWDSNPRNAHTFAGFQDRCLQPLGHPSKEVTSHDDGLMRQKPVKRNNLISISFFV